MYDRFSSQAKQIIVRSHKYALSENEYVVGTEHLLLALYNESNSSCNILLKELDINEKDILDSIYRIDVFRKNIPGLVLYTPKYKVVLDGALEIAKICESDLVYEEHLFYALLNTLDCIARAVLKDLNVDINDLIDEIVDVMDWELEDEHEEVKQDIKNFTFVENITSLVKSNKLLPLIGRENIIDRIINILNKKNKRNVILIGNAGVGKTAIVEGLAQKYYNEKINKQILSLNITSLLAGTKYRGDFEQRIKDFLVSVSNKEDIIIFIDEIHNIINVGNGDSNLDVANILKPALARGDINCIGATTIDEYYKHIANDGALSRRFLPIFIEEPTLEETVNILLNIKKYYENFHKIVISDTIIPYLCEKVEKSIVNRYFPDKAIDVLDEACSYAKMHKINELSNTVIDKIIHTINNQEFSDISIDNLNKYPFIKRYFLQYYSNVRADFQPIVSILCKYQKEDDLTSFINDVALVFNIRNEAIKKLNLSNFQEEHSISNFIGAPPGYVGFENPNTLTKFVQKYPRSIIVLKNIGHGAHNITELIKDILTSGYIEDHGNNKVFFTNTIIIGTQTSNKNTIGFLDTKTIQKNNTDIKFNELADLNSYFDFETHNHYYDHLLKKYIQFFNTNGKELIVDNFENINEFLNEQTYIELEKRLYECIFVNKNSNKFILFYDKEKKTFVIS
ncbi:MAG: ATPase domain protein [Haloplasmataceae bacterium]|jgi:ATP-dependent Clp protease ATP-binding subunit ClpC|nr:ATPase domain protein [Haloplasmataceae bacterium]